MNQTFASYVAFAFLFLVGIFNMLYAAANVGKRKAKKGVLWFRLIIGFLIFCVSMLFGFVFIWNKM